MANHTKPQAPTAPVPPKTPAAPSAPEKKKREELPKLFTSAEEAQKAAADRTKGPRRAFTCELNGATYHVVANNEGRAGGIAFEQCGGKVTELGGKAKKAKPLGIDGIMAAVNSLPEAERAAVLAQLKAIAGAK